jgi:parvulin-like peptidyl-prolyl isomerase
VNYYINSKSLMTRILLAAALATNVFAQSFVDGAATSGARTEIAPGPEDTVLTIRGLCGVASNSLEAASPECTAVVSRRQFEDLIQVAAPNAPATASIKQNLANMYTELRSFEAAARRRGLDRSPQFQNTMEWLRLRTLAGLYRGALEKEKNVASAAEISDYYEQHRGEFAEVKLRRMLVPKNNLATPDKRESENKALEVARAFRDRAARGEDFDGLQRDAYIAAGFNALPPSTEVGNRRRSGLPAQVADEVFALGPGEVSQVENEPYSFVIYKVEAKRTLAREQVRDEIAAEITKQKREAALQSVTGSVHADLNEAYFGPAGGQADTAK